MEIITVDSPKAAILRRKAKPVGKVTPEISRLIDRMIATMRAANGVGLAAPQVGVGRRIFVAEVDERLYVCVDPVITRRSEEQEVGTEGCLSVPGIVADVPRAARLTLRAKSRRGRGITLQAEGFLARVIQHEVDHLDGVLFLDRVTDRSTIREVRQAMEVAAASE